MMLANFKISSRSGRRTAVLVRAATVELPSYEALTKTGSSVAKTIITAPSIPKMPLEVASTPSVPVPVSVSVPTPPPTTTLPDLPVVSMPTDIDTSAISDLLGSINPVLVGAFIAVAAVGGVLASGILGGKGNGVRAVAPSSVYKALAEPNLVLVDIRTPGEIKENGSPDLKAVKKTALLAQFSKRERDGTVTLDANFGDKLKRKLRNDLEMAIVLLDQTGSEARQAAAELQAAGFAKVFVVQGGATAWEQAADLPWRKAGTGLSLSLPSISFSGLDTLAEEIRTKPTLAKGAAALGAVAGSVALLTTQTESLFEAVGLFAAGQFFLTKLLYADERKKTVESVTKLVQDDIAPLELGDDLKQVAKALLEDDSVAKVTTSSKPKAVASSSSSSDVPANVEEARKWINDFKKRSATAA